MAAIPHIMSPERYEERLFSESKFVKVKGSSVLDIDMQYPKLKMVNAEEDCYVREEVYEMLLKAAAMLPDGYKLRILDAWRPFLLQKELYEVYSEKIIRDFGLEKCTEEERVRTIQKYVSVPNQNRDMPPVHTTGGAVDVTIIDEAGNELDMGTLFDAFSEKTYTAYFEDKAADNVKENRRLLYRVMTLAGFTNLPSEWWHYDYGDAFWAFYNKKPTIYRGVFAKEEIY